MSVGDARAASPRGPDGMGLNWELQIAAAMGADDRPLLIAAREAREMTRLHRYGAALQILWDRLVPVSRKESGRQRAFLLIHMGHVYRQWIIDVAFKCFREARDLSVRTDFVHGEMVAESSIGQLYLDWKEHERALVHFERSLARADEHAGRWWQRAVLAEVVNCLEALGHSERAGAGRRRLDRLDVEIQDELWGRPEEHGSLSGGVPMTTSSARMSHKCGRPLPQDHD